MAKVMLPQLAWHGIKEDEFPLPDRWQVEMCDMAGGNKPALDPAGIRAALASPIGTKPLRELARGKKEVVIIFDDMSRVTRAYEIVPHVLAELAEAGIGDKQVRFVCALGCHGSLSRLDFVKKLGEDVLRRFPVYNHNPFGNCVVVGHTKTYKTEVSVNDEVMRCDLKIAIGGTVPHPMSGFGGGGKIILPGVTSFHTTQHNHHNTYHDIAAMRGKLGMGLFDENPLRFDVEEAAELAGLDFMVNVLFNKWGETVVIFAGALKPAYAASVAEAKKHYLTPRARDKDIVIVNSFIKGNEAFLGPGVGYTAIGQKGGDVVLIANEPYGQVVHYLLGPFGENSFGPESQRGTVPPHVKRLIVYTEYPDLAGHNWYPKSDKVMSVHKWDDVLKILEADYPGAASIAVFPSSEIQYTPRQ
ncbi:MAG: lactate racemase domain-containing protein [Dehalococcoidia bacterium]|nr:lactate racemase domain-containing protein [Dehalococcoidia bacterium]